MKRLVRHTKKQREIPLTERNKVGQGVALKNMRDAFKKFQERHEETGRRGWGNCWSKKRREINPDDEEDQTDNSLL